MPDVEKNIHYVLHVRVEKVTTTTNTGLKAATGPAHDRQVEDIVNVVKKSEGLIDGIDFVNGVLDLTEKSNA